MEEAHRAGVIHQDLKPDNIWIEPNGRGGYTVKVLDFGLVKLGEADQLPTTAHETAQGKELMRKLCVSKLTHPLCVRIVDLVRLVSEI